MTKAQRDIHRKTRVLEHAVRIGNMRKTFRSNSWVSAPGVNVGSVSNASAITPVTVR